MGQSENVEQKAAEQKSVPVGQAMSQLMEMLNQIQNQQAELMEYGAELARAQNEVGVMQLTVLQLLKEKNVLQKSEVKKALEENFKKAIDEMGNFKLPHLMDLMPEDEVTE